MDENPYRGMRYCKQEKFGKKKHIQIQQILGKYVYVKAKKEKRQF